MDVTTHVAETVTAPAPTIATFAAALRR